MGAFNFMTTHAILHGRHDESRFRRGLAIHHDGRIYIFTSRPVTFLTLNAVQRRKGLVFFPLLDVSTRGMASETRRCFLRLQRDAAQPGNFFRLRHGQDGIGAGVF